MSKIVLYSFNDANLQTQYSALIVGLIIFIRMNAEKSKIG